MLTFSLVLVLFSCFLSSRWPFPSVQVAACWTAASLMTQRPQLWPSASASSTSVSLRRGPGDQRGGDGWAERADRAAGPRAWNSQGHAFHPPLLSPPTGGWGECRLGCGQFEIMAHTGWLQNIYQHIYQSVKQKAGGCCLGWRRRMLLYCLFQTKQTPKIPHSVTSIEPSLSSGTWEM